LKKTIEQIRIEKGFETAGEFANYIGMAGPNYSQVATGKKPVTRNMIFKLKKCYPDENFEYLIDNDITQVAQSIKKIIDYSLLCPNCEFNKSGEEFIKAICYRLDFLGKELRDHNIIYLIRQMDNRELNQLISLGYVSKWNNQEITEGYVSKWHDQEILQNLNTPKPW